jgi:hypothetical protein
MSLVRSFSERLSELHPKEVCGVGFHGDPVVDNTVSLVDSGTLVRNVGYSGTDYTLAGPPDTGATPVQLGFKPGDKILLIGPSGGEPNDLKEYTLLDPSAWTVLETMSFPDATEYEFVAIRRVP